jgi:hypothetical protein
MMNRPEETFEILTKVVEVSDGYRNPDLPGHKRRMEAGRICCRAAFPMDLGAKKRDQSIVKKMRTLSELGLLEEFRLFSTAFPLFRITKEGLDYLARNTPAKPKHKSTAKK